MQRKKAPILLLAALVILVGAVAVTNMANFGMLSNLGQGRNNDVVQDDGHGHDHDSEANARSEIKDRMKTGVKAEPDMPKSAAATNPSKPTVEVEPTEKYKPKPSGMQTSGQWYDEKSGADKMPPR